MNLIEEIEAKRKAILEEMLSMRSMKIGTVTEQFFKAAPKENKEPALRGPYYVYTWKQNKKTVGYRLTSKEEVERVKYAVAAHRRFTELCKEFERLTERLGELERAAKTDSLEKKPRKSRSRKTPK